MELSQVLNASALKWSEKRLGLRLFIERCKLFLILDYKILLKLNASNRQQFSLRFYHNQHVSNTKKTFIKSRMIFELRNTSLFCGDTLFSTAFVDDIQHCKNKHKCYNIKYLIIMMGVLHTWILCGFSDFAFHHVSPIQHAFP